MLGVGEEHSINVAYVRARGLVRTGAMRELAEFVDSAKPTAMGVCEIDAGDALSLATRFALQWAYRGRQALFWRMPFRAHAVHDRYLPVRAARLFDRRGLLIVDADASGEPCMLAATQLRSERESFVPELRFARRHLRGLARALLFADMPQHQRGFADLGYAQVADGIFVRGFTAEMLEPVTATI